MDLLREVKREDLSCNVFRLFGEGSPLLTAGDRNGLNTMTIGWGGLGTLWGKPVCTVYVRPERYTYDFMEKSDYFTVSAFDSSFRREMAFCGRKSGREVDKVRACGFTPCFAQGDAPYFAEAELVVVCRKLYAQDLREEYLTKAEDVLPYYEKDGWHRMYIGEVVQVLKK